MMQWRQGLGSYWEVAGVCPGRELLLGPSWQQWWCSGFAGPHHACCRKALTVAATDTASGEAWRQQQPHIMAGGSLHLCYASW
jgi:hypothetical protein